jgi:hypothetical protein
MLTAFATSVPDVQRATSRGCTHSASSQATAVAWLDENVVARGAIM